MDERIEPAEALDQRYDSVGEHVAARQMLGLVGEDGGLFGGREAGLEVDRQDDREAHDGRAYVCTGGPHDGSSANGRVAAVAQGGREPRLLHAEHHCVKEGSQRPGSADRGRPDRSTAQGGDSGKAARGAEHDRRDRSARRGRNQTRQRHHQGNPPEPVGGRRPEGRSDRPAKERDGDDGGASGQVRAEGEVQGVSDHRRAPR